MPEEPTVATGSLIPSQPIPLAAEVFSKRMRGLLDGQPKDDATIAEALEGQDEIFELIAAGLYSLASMLVGEGEESVQLVETAVATAEVSLCHDPQTARMSSRRALSTAALGVLAKRDPESLAVPEGLEKSSTCIEDDDVTSAGISNEEFENMIGGPDRERVRKWLESLPMIVRNIFVLRAVAGFTAVETAELLKTRGGAAAVGWTPEAVREVFRQGLCSLASQLIHATAER
jgi:DNA-directed RNA polymerase specialized sigma24 family protein